jgi:hypothetical protein
VQACSVWLRTPGDYALNRPSRRPETTRDQGADNARDAEHRHREQVLDDGRAVVHSKATPRSARLSKATVEGERSLRFPYVVDRMVMLHVLTIGSLTGRLTGRRLGVLAVREGPVAFTCGLTLAGDIPIHIDHTFSWTRSPSPFLQTEPPKGPAAGEPPAQRARPVSEPRHGRPAAWSVVPGAVAEVASRAVSGDTGRSSWQRSSALAIMDGDRPATAGTGELPARTTVAKIAVVAARSGWDQPSQGCSLPPQPEEPPWRSWSA